MPGGQMSLMARELLAQARQADHLVGLGDVFLLQIEQVGAAGQQLRWSPAVVQQGDGVFRRRRPIVT